MRGVILVVPAQAGTHSLSAAWFAQWLGVPACAGTTRESMARD